MHLYLSKYTLWSCCDFPCICTVPRVLWLPVYSVRITCTRFAVLVPVFVPLFVLVPVNLRVPLLVLCSYLCLYLCLYILCARILVLVHVFCGPAYKLTFCKARRYTGAVHSVRGTPTFHVLVPVDLHVHVLCLYSSLQLCLYTLLCLCTYTCTCACTL